jgi:hypothetical protein
LLCNDSEMDEYTGTVSGQRLGKHVPEATDTNATIEELCFLCGPFRDVISKGQFWKKNGSSWTNIYETWYAYQRRTSSIPPISLCLYVYPLLFARQRLDKNVTAPTNTHTTTKNYWTSLFYEVRVVSKESRRLVLPRTSPFWYDL